MLSAIEVGLMPDPYHCPDCHATLVDIDGVGGCPRCGFSAADPRATRIWQIDMQIAGLAHERVQLLEEMRAERPVAPAPPVGGTAQAARPHRVRRAMSAQAVLVTVGAVLLVVAGIVFAAVTWERLGAAGQAAVLAAATATAATATHLTARRRLVATAEALSVVTAGFALVDVHAARIALAPEGAWQPVWTVGLVAVAVGLLALGRVGRLRVPAVLGVVVAQVPLAVMASMSATLVPAVASALVVTAGADHVVARRVARAPTPWMPDPTQVALMVLGVAAWALAMLWATPWAFNAPTDASVASAWWGIAVLGVGALEAGALAERGGRRAVMASLAAAASVLTTLLAALAIVVVAGVSGAALQFTATALPVVVLAAAVVALRGRDRESDRRLRAAQIGATVWLGVALLTWVVPVLAGLVAPLAVLGEYGWWTAAAGATTGSLGVVRLFLDPAPSAGEIAAMLGSVAVGTAGVVAVVHGLFRPSPVVRRRLTVGLVGLGSFVFATVVAAFISVPVAAVVAVYFVAGAAVVVLPVRPGRETPRPWVALASVPLLSSAVLWAGSVAGLTVAVLGGLTVLAVAAVAIGLGGLPRPWTVTATAVAGVALAATALTFVLALGATAATAWVVATITVVAASGTAWYADRRAGWWALTVDVTAVALVAVTLLGTAIAGGADPVSIGLAVVAMAAAAHVLRPTRRWVAAGVAAGVALVLLWLRLWVGDVRAVEAYTLPAAALLLIAGWRLMVRHHDLGSWPALGPGLLVAAAPSVFVAVAQEGVVRPLVVLGVAVGVTVLGAVMRLQAPLLVGAVTAVAMAVDQLFPVVAQLPRWVAIGAAGLLLLVLGATFERRRKEAVGAYHRYRELR